MKQTLARGFTLIELLVVIAIIGILAAVVLTSLTGAQQGAQNSNIQQALGSAVAGAQLYFNNNDNQPFNYQGLCGDIANVDSEVATALDNLVNAIPTINGVTTDGTAQAADQIYCSATVTSFVIAAPFVDDGVYCVDSDGFRGTRTGTDQLLSANAESCS